MTARGLVAGGAAIAAGVWGVDALGGSPELAITAAGLLETVSVPAAVHWSNPDPGEFWAALAASYGLSVLGVVLVAKTDMDWEGAAIIIPLSQLAASIWIRTAGR